MTLFGRSSFAALALLCVVASSFAQSIEIKPRWMPGKRYVHLMTMEQETKMEMAGQKMTQQFSTSNEVSTVVAPHEDAGKSRLRQKYHRVTMDMDMAGQKMHFDSNAPSAAGDPLGMGKVLGGMVGKELRLVIDANGKLLDVENLEEITKPMTEANPMAGQMLKGMFNKETIAQSFNQAALKALPGKAIKPGDSWPYTMTMALPQLGSVSMQGKYTFKGMVERGGAQCAELLEEGKVSMDMNIDTAAAGGAAGAPKLSMKGEGGTISGTVWFDPALGMARESQATQKMTMQMANPVNPGGVMSIPTTQVLNVQLAGVEDAKEGR